MCFFCLSKGHLVVCYFKSPNTWDFKGHSGMPFSVDELAKYVGERSESRKNEEETCGWMFEMSLK